MSDSFEIAYNKVSRYSREVFPSVSENEEKQLFINYESTVVMIEVLPIHYNEKLSRYKQKHDLPEYYVRIMAVLLMKAPQNPAIYQWIATRGQEEPFGNAELYPQRDGTAAIVYTYSLSADTLDPAELKWAVLTVALTADTLDDELKTRFGGLRHVDHIQTEG